MEAKEFIKIIGSDFYTGVPDSRLRAFCDCLIDLYGVDPRHHIIAANEGNCVAIAAGYHLATKKIPVVYLQNSGEGNIVNPVVSLLNTMVFAVPVIFVIGWRGEPGIKDEPQHIYQGEITLKLLEDMQIESYIIGATTSNVEINEVMTKYRRLLLKGQSVAFVIRAGALENDRKIEYKNSYTMVREKVIQHVVQVSENDPIISTTGKASRELFETRVLNQQGHECDFLTVGSMGHASSIALGIALNVPGKKIWCIDGDGAVLMHMGALAVIGAYAPQNLIHLVINNEAHASVGGEPTVAKSIDLVSIAKACGYVNAVRVDNHMDLDTELKLAKNMNVLSFIEIRCSLEARENLGRPTISTIENKMNFMKHIK